VHTPAAPAVRYFDHAATSWPKPVPVIEAFADSLVSFGGNPGRGAHAMALRTGRAVLEARRSCAEVLGVSDSRDVIFTASSTCGINMALKGLLDPGDRVVTTSMEHNAVARPLNTLAKAGVTVDVVYADPTGQIDPDDVERAVQAAPTRMVVCQHASNVTGSVQPIGDLADIAHEAGALAVVDGSQGPGHLPVDIDALGVDVYATSGHKGLLGPQGVGLLYLKPGVDPRPFCEGGTGGGTSGSLEMPSDRPDRYEAGTLNTPGIIGVGAAARFVAEQLDEIHATEQALGRRLHEGLLEIDGIRVLGPDLGLERVPVFTVVHESVEPDRIAFELDRKYGIAVRAGLHCAPWAHETLGTSEGGGVRISIGWGLDREDVEYLLASLRELLP